jgi:hypothetical protein
VADAAGKAIRSAPALLVPALLALMALLLATSSRHKKLSYDEWDNLAYGHRLLTQGPVLPPNGQRMPLLALNALGCPTPCREAEVNASEGRLLAVRAPTMAFALLLGLLVWGWAREWWGERAALLALFLYVLHPSFLAHGKQVTTDVHLAFFAVATLWPLWRWTRSRGPTWLNLVLSAGGFAGALVSKYTAVFLLPVLVVLFVAELARRSRAPRAGDAPPGPASGRTFGRTFGSATLRLLLGALAWAALALVLVNAVYAFDGTLRRADTYAWKSERLRPLARAAVPLPLPRVFVLGLDFSFHVQEQPDLGRGFNYVLGRRNTEGVWYAFPLMVLLKTPLAALLLPFLGGRPGRDEWRWLAMPFAVILACFSLLVAPQLGIRYVLGVLPFLLLAAARPAAASAGPRRRLAVGGLVLWAAISALSYHPHYMSYFNELIGARADAWRFLADSNLDWEDRSYDIERFRAAHPGIPVAVDPETPTAGLVLVGANKLTGVYEPERYRWLRENFTPEGHVGYSYLVFRVPPERLRAVLAGEP